jgi:hypothetical protein
VLCIEKAGPRKHSSQDWLSAESERGHEESRRALEDDQRLGGEPSRKAVMCLLHRVMPKKTYDVEGLTTSLLVKPKREHEIVIPQSSRGGTRTLDSVINSR